MNLTAVIIVALIVISHSVEAGAGKVKCRTNKDCQCGTTPQITNGTLTNWNNTTATYSCNSGRNGTVDCIKNGTSTTGIWETADCSVLDCNDHVPQHGAANNTITAFGAILKITCDSGYNLSGNAEIVCQANGSWSNNPTCEIIDCSDPVPLYGVNNSTNTTFGTVLKFTCDDGNNLSANAIITCQANGSWSFNPTCETIISSSSTTLPTTTTNTTAVLTESTTTTNTTAVLTESPTSTNTTAVQTESNTTTNTTVVPYPEDKSPIVISVIVAVVVVIICAIIVAILLIRRRRKQVQTKVKFHGTSEREYGNSISSTSSGNHGSQITNISANKHVPNGTSNDYAQIVDSGISLDCSGIRVNEQTNEYQTIDDIPHIKPSGNASYSHVKSQTAIIMDSTYSHIEYKKKVKTNTVEYGFSKFKRGISAMKKSLKKKADNSYDKLEMKTVACDASKNVEDIAVTELESEYNHPQSGVTKSIKVDIHNEKDEYSHLNYKPKTLNPIANEEAITDFSCQRKPKLNHVLQPKIGGNENDNAIVIKHDYLELEPVGESGDDSIKNDEKSQFEGIDRDGTYGFQYACATEIHQNRNERNEDKETKENQIENVFQYEFAKNIDGTSDLGIEPADNKANSGSNETTEGENPCHYYFTLSKT